MNLIRPIRLSDLDALLHMAERAGSGFTSLPPVPEFLQKRIEWSERSFAAEVQKPGHELYMFVLEDSASGRIGGCCAIEAACGLDEPFYNYHVGATVNASRALTVYNLVPTLYLSNDYTGASVLCSLYLSAQWRERGNGRLLSRSRFLFMAQFIERFAVKVIAEMRGVSDEQGHSPFWEGLGRHFFAMDYGRAEHLVGMGNKSFIAELMPKHPIYTVLLPPEARAVMGKVHTQTAPALHLLEQEGFRHHGYIDIFDGGPTVEAPLKEIRSVRRSRIASVGPGKAGKGTPHLVCNTSLNDFRCALVALDPASQEVALSQDTAAALNVATGDALRLVIA